MWCFKLKKWTYIQTRRDNNKLDKKRRVLRLLIGGAFGGSSTLNVDITVSWSLGLDWFSNELWGSGGISSCINQKKKKKSASSPILDGILDYPNNRSIAKAWVNQVTKRLCEADKKEWLKLSWLAAGTSELRMLTVSRLVQCPHRTVTVLKRLLHGTLTYQWKKYNIVIQCMAYMIHIEYILRRELGRGLWVWI